MEISQSSNFCQQDYSCHTCHQVGGGWGFSKVVATFNRVGGFFNLCCGLHHVWIILCLNNPIFSSVGLCTACWAYFECHQELWPTSVSHPFSSVNSSIGLSGGKHYQKIIIPIFRLILQNFTFPGCFSYILFYRYIFSLLSSGYYSSMWIYFSQGIS